MVNYDESRAEESIQIPYPIAGRLPVWMGKINIMWHSMDPMSSHGPGCPILECLIKQDGRMAAREQVVTNTRNDVEEIKKKADEASALHAYIGKSTSDGWQLG
jgi:hypothetical protein